MALPGLDCTIFYTDSQIHVFRDQWDKHQKWRKQRSMNGVQLKLDLGDWRTKVIHSDILECDWKPIGTQLMPRPPDA